MNAPQLTTDSPRDPRVVGGRYRSFYWDSEYTVLAISFTAVGVLDSITVRDGQGTRIHGTAWDDRDQIVFDPRSGPVDITSAARYGRPPRTSAFR